VRAGARRQARDLCRACQQPAHQPAGRGLEGRQQVRRPGGDRPHCGGGPPPPPSARAQPGHRGGRGQRRPVGGRQVMSAQSTAQGKDGAHIRVRRYSGSARVNHWIVALSFVLLLLSGLSLFHPSLYWLSALFGGGATVRWLHPWLGLILAVGFLGLFLRFFTQNLPETTDFVWLARLKHVLTANDNYLPEIGKYNAGQKFVFWSQFVLVGVLLVTGIGLWETGLAWIETTFGFTATLEQKRWAALIHATAAVLAIVIWIVHVYAAIWVRGTISGMTRGFVTGGWGWRHHRKWLRKEVDKGAIDRPK